MKRAELEKLGLTPEAIKAAGLSENLIDEIMKIHGTGVQTEKSKAADLEKQIAEFSDQIKAANDKIESLSKLKDVSEVQKETADWKAKAEQAAKERDETIKNLKFEHALSDGVATAGAKNKKSVMALLNREGLKYNDADGTIIGLADQLEKIKESDGYLFNDKENTDGDGNDSDPKFSTRNGGNATAKPTFADAISEAIKK